MADEIYETSFLCAVTMEITALWDVTPHTGKYLLHLLPLKHLRISVIIREWSKLYLLHAIGNKIAVSEFSLGTQDFSLCKIHYENYDVHSKMFQTKCTLNEPHRHLLIDCLNNVDDSTSHNHMGLHCLLYEYIYLIFLYLCYMLSHFTRQKTSGKKSCIMFLTFTIICR
jgi:hypothetical protein